MNEQRIFKYELSVIDGQNIRLPIGSQILTVQNQNETPCMWALVDPNADTELITIEMFGTGHPVLSDMGTSRKYISTFQMHGGNLVFHVFQYTGI